MKTVFRFALPLLMTAGLPALAQETSFVPVSVAQANAALDLAARDYGSRQTLLAKVAAIPACVPAQTEEGGITPDAYWCVAEDDSGQREEVGFLRDSDHPQFYQLLGEWGGSCPSAGEVRAQLVRLTGKADLVVDPGPLTGGFAPADGGGLPESLKSVKVPLFVCGYNAVSGRKGFTLSLFGVWNRTGFHFADEILETDAYLLDDSEQPD